MAEEFRSDEKFVILADVPGLRQEDIAVTITSGILHIRAAHADGTSVPESDLREGAFTRDIRLPLGTDEAGVRATYTDGVLEVMAPMRDSGEATRVVPVISGDPKGADLPIR